MKVYFAGEPFPVLADTGCSLTCMSQRLLPPDTTLVYKDIRMNAANRTTVRIVGEVTLTFSFGPDSPARSYQIAVSPDLDGIIFGIDLLTKFGASWNLGTEEFSIDGQRIPLHPHSGGPQARRVYMTETVVLQPRHEHDVVVDIPYSHSDDRAPTLVYEAREIQPGVVAASVALPGFRSTAAVKLMNVTKRRRVV